MIVFKSEDPVALWGADSLTDNYGKTILWREDVSMRFVQKSAPPDPDWKSWWTIIFEEDVVKNAAVGGGSAKYKDLKILTWDGRVLDYPKSVSEKDLQGMDILWKRNTAFRQERRKSTCPSEIKLDSTAIRGPGWSVPEQFPDGSYGTWMEQRRALLLLDSACRGNLDIRIHVVNAMSDDILNSAKLKIDGHEMSFSKEQNKNGWILSGKFTFAKGNEWLPWLEIDVPGTIQPIAGGRNLSLMISSVLVDKVPGK